MKPDNNIFKESIKQDDDLFVVNNLSFESEPHLKFKVFTIEMASLNTKATGEINLVWLPKEDRSLVPAFDTLTESDSPVLKATWQAAEEQNEIFFQAIEKAGIERYEIMGAVNDYIDHPAIVHDGAVQVSDIEVTDTLVDEKGIAWNDPSAGHEFRLEADVLVGGEGEHIEDRINLRELYTLTGGDGIKETKTYGVIMDALQDGRREILTKGNETLSDERIASGLAKDIINYSVTLYRKQQQEAIDKLSESKISSIDDLAKLSKSVKSESELDSKVVSMNTTNQKRFEGHLKDAVGSRRFVDMKRTVGVSLKGVGVDEFKSVTEKAVAEHKANAERKAGKGHGL